MMKLQPKKGIPKVVSPNTWVEVSVREFTSGNVVIRNIGNLDRPGQKWIIFIRSEDGTDQRVGTASRPWFYGSLGQARIGAAKISKVIALPLPAGTPGASSPSSVPPRTLSATTTPTNPATA